MFVGDLYFPPLISESLTLALSRIIFTYCLLLLRLQRTDWLLPSLSADMFVGFLNAGGPGVHDPCERDPTDVLSDLSPQQADTITESAQVSHISCCHLPLLPTQHFSFASEVFHNMSSGFLCVSAWSMKTCDLLVLIYIHIKQFIKIFFSSHCDILGCSSGRQWAVFLSLFILECACVRLEQHRRKSAA